MSGPPWPTLVLMPGMDGTGTLFAPFLAALPPDLPTRVLRYPPDRALGYPALEAIASAQLPDGDLVLLGESFSGPLAVALAAKLGPRVRGLVLCCTFVRSPSPFLRLVRPLTRWVPVEATPRWVLFRALLDPAGPPALRPLLLDAMAQVAPRALRERLHAMAGVDARAALATCRSHVLYLQAGRDRLVPSACGDLVLAVRPDATRLTLEGPHGLLQTLPSPCARAVVDFVRRSTGSPISA